MGHARPISRVGDGRLGSNPDPGPGREGPESLRVFGCLPDAGARGGTEAGVRKASREETAGGVRTGGGVRLWRFRAGV